MKKILSLVLCLCLLTASVSAAFAENAPQVELFRESKVYNGRLDRPLTLNTYHVEGFEDVPFVKIGDFAKMIYDDLVVMPTATGVTLTRNDFTLTIDCTDQTAKCDNWEAFTSENVADLPSGSILSSQELLAIGPSVKHQSVSSQPAGYTVTVPDGILKMIPYENDVLFPFQSTQTLVCHSGQCAYTFNGADYYRMGEFCGFIYGNPTPPEKNPYADQYFSGPFSTQTELTESYNAYFFASLCFDLDQYFGHKEALGIESMEAFIEALGLKGAMLSRNPETITRALNMLVTNVFSSGHDSMVLPKPLFGNNPETAMADAAQQMLAFVARYYEEGTAIGPDQLAELVGRLAQQKMEGDEEASRELYQLLMLAVDAGVSDAMDTIHAVFGNEQGDSGEAAAPAAAVEMTGSTGEAPYHTLQELVESQMRFVGAKSDDYGTARGDIDGDTAVIYFNSFTEDVNRVSYYVSKPTEADLATSTFGLFRFAFTMIENYGGVKNVVINLTDNVGGAAAGLIAALGFLSEDGEVHLTTRHLRNANYNDEWFHVDTNLDGVFDDNDGYGGQYNFYILCTASSYSCANAMPYYAQKDGLAKIIGELPGGGDCVVNMIPTAMGQVVYSSGPMQLGRMDGDHFVTDEKDTVVDAAFPEDVKPSDFFDPSYIAEFVRSLAE